MNFTCPYEKDVLKQRKLFIIFSLLSLLVPALTFIDFFMPDSETFNTWFQRSGSIMVVFALLAEMRAYNMIAVYTEPSMVELSYASSKEKYYPQAKLCNVIAFTLIAIASVIWGYGDLIAKNA